MKKWFGLALLLLVCSCDVKKGNGNDVTENEQKRQVKAIRL